MSFNRARQLAGPLAARMFWNLPGRFAVARFLGRSYRLRCVVFHNISPKPSPFTAGIRVSITPQRFEAALQFLTTWYTPVRLADVLSDCEGRGLSERAVLVTFDDAYASVAEYAAPLCRKYGISAAFFVNAAFLDNRRLAPDNLVCYAASMSGMKIINQAARSIRGREFPQLTSLSDVFGEFFPSISLPERAVFLDTLCHLADLNEKRVASEANLYLTSNQLRELSWTNFEIGNHTYTHTHCRSFGEEELAAEIDRNKDELEAVCGSKVRSFSVPYGSSKDLTPALEEHLRGSGHEAVFLSESVANPSQAGPYRLDRVSTGAERDHDLFFEVEILPRLRSVRRRWFHHSSRRKADLSVSWAQPCGKNN